MMRKTGKLSSLFTLLLFAAAAISILSVLIAGVGVYTRIQERDENTYNARTAVRYITTKMQQLEPGTRIDIGSIEDITVLTLSKDDYQTQIYCYEGYLYELYHVANSGLVPADGERLVPLTSLDFAFEQGILTAELEGDDGIVQELRLAVRQEVQP